MSNLGKIVLYTLPQSATWCGESRPAVIVRQHNEIDAAVEPGKANLRLLLDGPNDAEDLQAGRLTEWVGGAIYSADQAPGTWRNQPEK